MEIRNLITFTKVAESQSLSKAAKELGYAQSTVTMQMQQLEQELGVSLYERVGKQIRITQTGQEFLSYATAILRMSEEALQVGKQSTSAITGSLRLGVLSMLSGKTMSSRIARYVKENPQVDLSVQSFMDPDELLSKLRHNEIDLAVTLDLLRSDPDLIHACKDQLTSLFVFTRRDHPLAKKTGVTAGELAPYPFIRTVYPDETCKSAPVPTVAGQLQISDISMALSIIADVKASSKNDYLVLAPDFIVREHPAAKELIRLDYEHSDPGFWLQILYHRNKWLTGAMKAWLSDSEDFF